MAKKESTSPVAEGETSVQEGTTVLDAPLSVNEPKEKITLANGTVVEHF